MLYIEMNALSLQRVLTKVWLWLSGIGKTISKKHMDNLRIVVQNRASIIVNTIMKTLEKIFLRGNLSRDALNYFIVEGPKFARVLSFT